MNWLQNNPLGVALAGTSGFLVLVGVALTLFWSGPVDSGNANGQVDPEDLPTLPGAAEDLGAIKDYQVVNDRPLFNESRRPVVVDVADPDEQEPVQVVTEGVADAPQVRLTGVVITPEEKLVSLTPVQGGKTLLVREGNPLEGEYVGWSVSEVTARHARLSSTTGESLNVELMVHDAMIERPPEPDPPLRSEDGREERPMDGDDVVQDEANLSRAEEIRQRIRERREQLRREAENESESEDDQREARRNAYQDAIQAMMQRNNKSNDDDGDGDGE